MTAHQKEEKEEKKEEHTEETNSTEQHYESPQTIKTLLAWKSAGRPFRKRSKQYYMSSLLIAFLIIVILFLFKQLLLILVVLSLLFLAFSLASVPPANFQHRISTEGVTIEDHFFLWQELYDFYFKTRENEDVLHIRTHSFYPGELTLTLGDISKNHIKEVLLPYLPFREVIRKTFMDKAEEWLTKNFPLENPKHHKQA